MTTRRPRPFPRTLTAFAAFCIAGLPCSAATFTWDGLTGNWSLGTNWAGDVAPTSNPANELAFGGIDYTATHDLGAAFNLNALLLSTPSFTSIQNLNASGGSTLSFVANAAINPNITQGGSGDFRIDIPISLDAPTTFGGSSLGLGVSFFGPINGTNTLAITGGTWRFGDINSTWSGVTSISGTALVQVRPETPGAIAFTAAAPGIFGSNTNINFDGGTLQLITDGANGFNLGTNRILTFAANGGTVRMVNSNPSAPTTHAGQRTGGDFAVTLNNTTPAVFQFNGGEVGLSQIANPFGGDWSADGNTLRFRNITGSGPMRIELTNGALARAGTGATGTIASPTTIRGVAGGDPTSGPLGTDNTSVSRDHGRFNIDNANVVTYSGGLFFEDAMQVATTGSTRAFDGNIFIAGTASGHPGYVAFAGRSTGTNVGSAVNAPGTGGVGQNFLYLGQNGDDILTIEGGGTAVLDLRFRGDQPDHHGVLLNATTVIHAGGKLRFLQSMSSFSPLTNPTPNAAGNVGNHVVQGDILAEGSTSSEAIIDLYLPAANVLQADETVAGRLPHGGIDFQASSAITVNGSGFGGLRVNALSRPNSLFSGATADPVANTDKLNNYLTAPRLASLTGTGGYLTPAAESTIFSFPAGGEWAPAVTVGLKAVDSNASGSDVTFGAAGGSFTHNLHVASGAVVETGNLPFTLGPATATAGLGLVSGKGTISGTGGVILAPGAILSPGEGDPGTLLAAESLSLSLGTKFVFDLATPLTSDKVTTTGTLTLSGQQFSDFTFNTLAGFDQGTYTLFENAALAGTLGSNLTGTVGGLPASIAVSGTDVVLNVVPEPSALLSLFGGGALLVGLRRRSFRR